jgi:DNA-binding NarL/FixJ family response regulator
MTDDRIRILVCDHHPLFRQGLRALAAAVPSMEIVGEAGSGPDAVAGALGLRPDVVVVDLHAPGMNGIDTTRRIVAASPRVAVLVLTMSEDDDSVLAAMRVGARGYLLKSAGHAQIVRAICAVASGEAIFGPTIAERLIAFFSASSPGPPQAFPDLTAREREVLELIAQGEPNKAIARQLVLSVKTVCNHASSIYTKLQVVDRSQAIVRAREAGMGVVRV